MKTITAVTINLRRMLKILSQSKHHLFNQNLIVMKKIFTYFRASTLLLSLLFSLQAAAQKISCSFLDASFTRPYEYLSSGTAVDDIEADEATKTIPIGFTFRMGVCGSKTSHTNLQVSSNGWAKLLSSGTASTSAISDPGSTVGRANAKSLAPFWTNLSGVGGEASYETILLPSGLKVFTMEWKNWKWDATAALPSISFQLKLYEGSDIIEFCYKQESSSAVTLSGSKSVATIAIMDGSAPSVVASCYDVITIGKVGSALVINKGGAWGAGIDFLPADNQVYQFYQTCCGKPTAGIISQPDSVCAGSPFVLKASGSTPNPFSTYGVKYRWQAAPSATGPWTDFGLSATTQTIPGIYTDSFFRMIVQCDSAKPVPMFDTTPVKHITLITQSFNCYCYSSATNDILNVNIGNVKLIAAGKDTMLNNGNGLPSFINKGAYRPYSLFTGLSPIREINRDTTYDFSVMGVTRDSFAFSSSGVALYIDYNADGVYNASIELVVFQVISGTSASFVKSVRYCRFPRYHEEGCRNSGGCATLWWLRRWRNRRLPINYFQSKMPWPIICWHCIYHRHLYL
jgi:hypothetical protein